MLRRSHLPRRDVAPRCGASSLLRAFVSRSHIECNKAKELKVLRRALQDTESRATRTLPCATCRLAHAWTLGPLL
eukprot:1769491-Amphidinium_carterae.1